MFATALVETVRQQSADFVEAFKHFSNFEYTISPLNLAVHIGSKHIVAVPFNWASFRKDAHDPDD